ncbi:MAG: hypothetical protein DLM70_00495 [Chloroflexi bacterium]|nr:MAG: hypothetical protein DLM70_00495 [Chloroflexota bacterium]
MLSDNNARCGPRICEFASNSPLLLSRQAAAKTGTTNSRTDNLTLGYTPQIVTGVWTGNADRSPMIDVIGLTGAAPIWHDFMEAAFTQLSLHPVPFTPPPDVVVTSQCRTGGNFIQFGNEDLTVNPASSLPLCQLPDRGFMPVPCSQYPTSPGGFQPQCSTSSYYPNPQQYPQSNQAPPQ